MRRSSKPLPKDPNQLAAEIVRLSTQDSPPAPQKDSISEYLAEIGRKGGLEGGKSRAKKLSGKRRRQIAIRAAKARWKSKKRQRQASEPRTPQ